MGVVMLPFRGVLRDGRAIEMGIPSHDYDNFVKEVIGHAQKNFCPPGLDFFEVVLQDGQVARLFVKAENKERFLNAIVEKTVQQARGVMVGEPATQTVMMPCKGCGGTGEKTLGLGSLIDAKLSGPSSETTRAVRKAVCDTCHDKNTAGERLFRLIDARHWCGVPRELLKPSTLMRDEKQDGCGCPLDGDDGKWAYKDAECPLGYWGKER